MMHDKQADKQAGKQAMRRRLLAARKAHHAQHAAQAADALLAQLPHLDIPPTHHIALYLPMGSEIDVLPLLERLHESGHRLCLPVCLADNQPVLFRAYAPGDRLQPDAMNIDAPIETAEEIQPDIIMLPLLGFDRQGGRLGRGGGYYDRTLAAIRAQRTVRAWGIAYDMQMVDKCPVEPHDQTLDAVLTDKAAYRFKWT